MKFENHCMKENQDDFFSLIEDFQFAHDDPKIKAFKDLEFYIRKPFCGCGKCSL